MLYVIYLYGEYIFCELVLHSTPFVYDVGPFVDTHFGRKSVCHLAIILKRFRKSTSVKRDKIKGENVH